MRSCVWMRCGVAGLCTNMVILGSLQAQQTTLLGQVRTRTETRDPSGDGAGTFTSMRVRLGLHASIDEEVSVLIQAQDVRIWGEETHPLRDYRADNLDIHQAYFRYHAEDLDWLTATVGRMETNLGGQRLVGAADWAQQAQSFDGVRLDLKGEPGTVALIAYTLADRSAPAAAEDRHLYGAYVTRDGVGRGSLDVYWLFENATGAGETHEHSLGARYAFRGDITGRIEGTLQTGTRAGIGVSAFMFGARVGRSFADGRAGVTLWYDYLSGDDPVTPEVEVFNTLYATNHKFYGFADVFLNVPAHTGGAGLQDLAVKLMLHPRDDFDAGVALHTFRVVQRGVLVDGHFGDELDITLTHRHSDGLTVVAGFSYVFQAEALGAVGRLSEDLKWFYLMFNAAF